MNCFLLFILSLVPRVALHLPAFLTKTTKRFFDFYISFSSTKLLPPLAPLSSMCPIVSSRRMLQPLYNTQPNLKSLDGLGSLFCVGFGDVKNRKATTKHKRLFVHGSAQHIARSRFKYLEYHLTFVSIPESSTKFWLVFQPSLVRGIFIDFLEERE